MGIEPFMVTSAVTGVLAQRLVRRICPQCGVDYEPAADELSFYRSVGGRGMTFRRGTGCAFCAHTGFHGRIGVYEVLRISDAIKRLLVRDAPPEALRERALNEGMTTLRTSGLQKVDEGQTTIAEVMRSVHLSEDTGA
jgi:type II secretory ATPase GspE/PulE/Tfp pilus assembly ATPase PilB-like protein